MLSSQNSQVSNNVNYIEDVFSTYLYTGNGSTQTITNGIDLAGKGGLTWIKYRDGTFGNGHYLYDTVRGVGKVLKSNLTDAESVADDRLTSFNSNGFSLAVTGGSAINASTYPYVSWTFREQPKFFDIVTYTGTGSNTTIAHNLGAVPGCIIVKRTDTPAAWAVYHRSLANTQYLVLNSDVSPATGATWWNSTTPTSTVFSIGTDASVNASGGTYVAYVYAHNAGGFGLLGTDNVISCGSYVGTGAANNQINLGYEPQWVLVKNVTSTGTDWVMGDIMRGMPIGGNFQRLHANLSAAEDSVAVAGWLSVYSQGIQINGTGGAVNATGDTYIYIAIRRGPMKVPELGTSVFSPNTYTGTGATLSVSGLLFPPDMVIPKWMSNGGGGYSTRPGALYDKLRGAQQELAPTSTAAESTQSTGLTSFNQSGFTIGTSSVINSSPDPYISWNFRRAPGFFDEVCYTGTGVARTLSHNLTTVPEFIICKNRTTAGYYWRAYVSPLGVGGYINFGTTDSAGTGNPFNTWNNTTPTSTVFSLGADGNVNANTNNFVAYLFATCAGVSKVGSYTGTGALQTVACGFTSGARFVLIKRTDSTGDWYVWDSARGITSGNDPYLLLNDTAAEVTGTNYVDTDTTGFQVTAAAPAGINANGGNYIFLAIA